MYEVQFVLCVSKISWLRNTCSAFGLQMWFTFENDDVHLRPTWKCKKISATTKIVMRFTSIYAAVHLPPLCGTLLFTKKLKEKTTKTRLRKIYVRQKKSWSSLDCLMQCGFRPMQCGFLSDDVHSLIWVSQKNSVRTSVILKLLLNRKELEWACDK